MIVYQVFPDDTGWGRQIPSRINATHTLKIPGVRCPKCGVYSVTGDIYPDVSAEVLHLEEMPERPFPISLEQFADLVALLYKHANVLVRPGAELGPLRGNASGTFGDFAWVNPWTPLVCQPVYDAMLEAGFALSGVVANLEIPENKVTLIELAAPPSAHLKSTLLPIVCETCGRIPISKPEQIVVDEASFCESVPIQRLAELPTVLIVTASFAQFIRKAQLTNVLLEGVDVA